MTRNIEHFETGGVAQVLANNAAQERFATSNKAQ
jgi:hypothetical protein